ncbi:MAG: DegV family protein [Phototrophicaceae bacterium]
MKIRFVVDSACDVPQALVQQHQMTVIPAFVNYNGESHPDDGVTFDRERYYEQLPSLHPYPTTSAPSVGIASEYLQTALNDADHVVAVSVGAKFSSIYNSYRLAAANYPTDKITLVDSGQLSMGGGWQAILGAEIATSTGDLDATLRAIQSVRAHQKVWAAVQSLEFMYRGGRLNWAQAAIGNFLRIRPIVEVGENVIKPAAQARKQSVWVQTLANFIRSQAPLERLALLHSNNLTALDDLREQIVDIMPPHVLTLHATPSIGTHTGPQAIGAATVSASWRDAFNASASHPQRTPR